MSNERIMCGITMRADDQIAHGSRLVFTAPDTPPRTMYLPRKGEAGAIMGSMTKEKLTTLYKKGVGKV